MAKIKFIVKSSIKHQPATIYMRFRDGRSTDIIIATPEKVFPEYWSNKTESFKQRILFTDVFTEKDKVGIELHFTQMRDFVLNQHYQLKGRPASREWLQGVLNKFYNRKGIGSDNLSSYISRFIVEAESGKRVFKGMRYTASTIKNYRGLEAQVNEYQGIYSEKRLMELAEKKETPRPLRHLKFNDITIDFYKDFISFFNKKHYSPNTIGRHIKQLKVIMRQAMEEGLHNNTEFQNRAFESMAVSVDSVYLTETELKKLFDLDLSSNKSLEIARDVFLCGCYTAQRYSDYSRINNDNIKTYSGKLVIDMIQQKTGERCIIPVRPELKMILEKYENNLPRTHEQKLNKNIKVICGMAGITEKVSYEVFKGGLKISKNIQKNELVKTHTARRSGCTNMYLAGIPVIDIMKISGHKTEREFLKYIRVTKEETALNLAEHPYFIGTMLKKVE